jgi:hypothetical protein
MAVYVDPLMGCVPTARWRFTKSCHLVADSLEELHEFAGQLGLKRGWFQSKSRVAHYDLTENKRKQAIVLGAIELSRREFADKFLPRAKREP